MRGWIVAGLLVLAVSGAGMRSGDEVQQDAPAHTAVDDHAPDAFSRMQRTRPLAVVAQAAEAPAIDTAAPAIAD